MQKTKMNQNGFGAIESLLVVLILVIVAFGGYYVWHSQHPTKKDSVVSASSNTKSVAAATDPYAGWKSATLTYEKISYKYPADWTVVDASQAEPKSQGGCTYPGVDNVSLISPSHEEINVRTGIACIGDGGSQAFSAMPINALGQNLYLVFENWLGGGPPEPTAPSFACLGRSQNPETPMDFSSKNIYFNGDSSTTPINSFCYYPYSPVELNKSGGQIPSETLSSIQSSKDFDTAKLIFESMKY